MSARKRKEPMAHQTNTNGNANIVTPLVQQSHAQTSSHIGSAQPAPIPVPCIDQAYSLTPNEKRKLIKTNMGSIAIASSNPKISKDSSIL
ncbi:hypothetical protein HK100_009900, partial [Physocladia obscura]